MEDGTVVVAVVVALHAKHEGSKAAICVKTLAANLGRSVKRREPNSTGGSQVPPPLRRSEKNPAIDSLIARVPISECPRQSATAPPPPRFAW